MKRLLLVSSFAFLLVPTTGCFLTGAEVGAIAGQLVAEGMKAVKEDTRNQIREAVDTATKAIGATNDALIVTNEKVQAVDQKAEEKPNWLGVLLSVVAVMAGGKGIGVAIAKKG